MVVRSPNRFGCQDPYGGNLSRALFEIRQSLRKSELATRTDPATGAQVTTDQSSHLMLFAAMEKQHLASPSIHRASDDPRWYATLGPSMNMVLISCLFICLFRLFSWIFS